MGRTVIACAVAISTSACSEGRCGLIVAPQATVIAHVPTSQLPSATVQFCRNGVCATGAVGANVFDGAPFVVGSDVMDEHDGYARVEVATTDPPFTTGDMYRLALVNAAGESFFDVTRPARFDQETTCSTTSAQARMELYADSAPNIECGNAWCDAGVHVTGSFTTTDTSTPIVFTLCRDLLGCAQGQKAIAELTSDQIEIFVELAGSPSSIGTLQKSGAKIDYDIQTQEDSRVLADGDLYTLVIVQGATPLVSAQRPARYSASYLNGQACDPVPCRTAQLAIP
jgi:hypothetical protein